MSLEVGESIPLEKHNVSQFIKIVFGEAIVKIGKRWYNVAENDMVTIPPNTYHEVRNNGLETLKIYTIYSPPQHEDKLVQIEPI
jgi:mannose-6-phosphate isomerase-like protein (cupin superfamily)